MSTRIQRKKRYLKERAKANVAGRKASYEKDKAKKQADADKAEAILAQKRIKDTIQLIRSARSGEDLKHRAPHWYLDLKAQFDNDKKYGQPNYTHDLYHLLMALNGRFIDEGRRYILALTDVAKKSHHWLRNPADWTPKTHNVPRQFSDLLRHTFTLYDVPLFLDKAFTDIRVEHKAKGQDWFIHIGQGHNIRTASSLPIPLTKKMAHHFLEAPDHYAPFEAIRWGQVHSLGGDERTMKGLAGTELGRSFNHDDFWVTVINFFIKNPMLDVAQYGPIIDYIRNQKYGNGFDAGPQPNLSMKQRNVNTLLREVERWHKILGKSKAKVTKWEPSGLTPYLQDGENSRIDIVELITAAALNMEGSAQKHCVSSYSYSCAAGRSSIWSLRSYNKKTSETKIILTIEVDLKEKKVVQAKKKLNDPMTTGDAFHLSRWAKQNQLTLAYWL